MFPSEVPEKLAHDRILQPWDAVLVSQNPQLHPQDDVLSRRSKQRDHNSFHLFFYDIVVFWEALVDDPEQEMLPCIFRVIIFGESQDVGFVVIEVFLELDGLGEEVGGVDEGALLNEVGLGYVADVDFDEAVVGSQLPMLDVSLLTWSLASDVYSQHERCHFAWCFGHCDSIKVAYCGGACLNSV